MAVKEVLASIPGIETESVAIGRAVIAGANLSAQMNVVETQLSEEGYPVKEAKELS